MKRRGKRIIVAALACVAALVFVGTAVAMRVVDTGTGGSTSVAVRPDDRSGVRGVIYAHVSQAVGSPMRGERSFGATQPLQLEPTSSGSGFNWGRTIAISTGAAALALALVGLTIVGRRQRKPLHA